MYDINGDSMKIIKKIKKLLFLLAFFLSYIYALDLLEKIDLDIKNDTFYENLINNSSSLTGNNIINYDTFKKITQFKPNQLLDNKFVYIEEQKKPIIDNVIVKPENKDPIVYIYNTHQTETYSTEFLTDYTITPSVMIASYMLKENLEDYGIYAYVEEDSVKNVLNKNKWKYAKSYTVTKQFMEKRKKEMPSIKYYIDLHRDSVKKEYTTITIDNVSYAKVMLLVGLDHDQYKQNLEEATKVNKIINKLYPGLSRGIYKKSGKGVNGIYNQDFSNTVFLFEIGGVDNNISEVNNTITALTEILVKYIKEKGDV